LDLYIWILTSIVVFIASLTMSIAGFGFGLVATPLLFLFLEPRIVVLFSSSLGSIIGLLVFLQARHFIKPKIIIILGLSSLVGIPIGIYMISHISILILKLIIGVLVIVFAIFFYFGLTYKIKRENLGCAISGFIGGIFMTGTGLGGPPVILYFINQAFEKQVFRASVASFFIITGIASFISLGVSGIASSANLLQTLTFIPVVIIAYFIGNKILPYINQWLFRTIVLAIIVISGTTGLLLTLFAFIGLT
jgi:uncharacterized protein